LIGLLLLINPFESSKTVSKINDAQRLVEYTSEIESKIASMCAMIKGASNVNVTVYFDSGFESIYAYNEEIKSTSNGTNSEKKYVTIGSGSEEKMVCIVERMPNISGVAVVCVGGGNSTVASEIINLISAAFNVPKNKIYVAEGKK
jgi:stage III sporulation protein AG